MSLSKIVLGCAATTALVTALAIRNVPEDERIVVEKPRLILSAEPKIEDRVETLPKTDRDAVVVKTTAVLPEPVTVEAARIRPDAPAKAPPVILVEEERPAARRHHKDTCTRHGMHKIETHGGKSWKCRR
jgi:hypothetical protein